MDPEAGKAEGAMAPAEEDTPIYHHRVGKGQVKVSLADEDFHQASLVFCSSAKVPTRWKLYYSSMSFGIVVLQLCATTALIVNVTSQRCDDPWAECDAGTWCHDMGYLGKPKSLCTPCGGVWPAQTGAALTGAQVAQLSYAIIAHSPWAAVMLPGYEAQLAHENATGVRATMPDFCTQGPGVLKAECDMCFDGKRYTTRGDVLYARVRHANTFDWFMLVLCTLLVSHSVSLEMSEVRMCGMLLRDSFLDGPTSCTERLWLLVGVEVIAVRNACLLPLVISTVPMFALGLGTEALNVALNSLAVLFILEVDQTMYKLGLTYLQTDWLATVEATIPNAKYHPSSRRMRMYDVLGTFVAVWLPILLNHFVGIGGGLGFGYTPMLELFMLCDLAWCVMSAITSCVECISDPNHSCAQKAVFGVTNTVFIFFHMVLTGGIFLAANEL